MVSYNEFCILVAMVKGEGRVRWGVLSREKKRLGQAMRLLREAREVLRGVK